MDKTNHICRVCFKEYGEFNFLFRAENHSSLAEMIMSFAAVQIQFGDGLPENVCESCAENIRNFYKFKLKCEQSDTLLHKKLKEDSCGNDKRDIGFMINQNNGKVVKSEIGIECNDINIVKPEVTNNEENTFTYKNSNEAELCNSFEIDLFERKTEDKVTAEKKNKNHINKLDTPELIRLLNKTTCNLCNENFENSNLLIRHQKIHEKCACASCNKSKINSSQCFICSQSFQKKNELNKHIMTHVEIDNEKILKCTLCEKELSSNKKQIIRHLKSHSYIKPYVCHVCEKGFVRSDQLHNHINKHSGTKLHSCEICQKGFAQLSNLKDHLRTHNGEKPFLCSECGKGFNQAGNLRQHIIRHNGIKPHLCSNCGKGFSSKGELSAHMRKHTGARPFVCDICNFGFTTSSSLSKHKRIHSGEKPYECETCKMKFSRSGILTRHMRTHTGIKPYKCAVCDRAFTQSNDLAAHVRIHTGEKPFVCSICGQAFRQKSALKTHRKIHFNVLNEWAKKIAEPM